jgi:hypothetical protein
VKYIQTILSIDSNSYAALPLGKWEKFKGIIQFYVRSNKHHNKTFVFVVPLPLAKFLHTTKLLSNLKAYDIQMYEVFLFLIWDMPDSPDSAGTIGNTSCYDYFIVIPWYMWRKPNSGTRLSTQWCKIHIVEYVFISSEPYLLRYGWERGKDSTTISEF